jgi:hypothetical protein
MCAGGTGKEDEWRECITDTDAVLGFALGALFIRNAFHGESKEKVWIRRESKLKNKKQYKKINPLTNLLPFFT